MSTPRLPLTPGTADTPAASERHILSVSALNRSVRELLETGIGRPWVEGEISNFARPSSGHWYFSLKDAQAQLRCAMFKMRNARLRFTPADGQRVIARGLISVYEARGDYQLIVETLEPAGQGDLQRAYEALRQRLAAEGLFDPGRKRPLPPVPARIGVITSPTGAAVRDILHILARRFAPADVLIYPVPVQGAAAAPAIAAMIARAGERAECDVLIVARGGGSLEDLWAFNDEAVARAIAASPIPVVSAVGHETDVTIADFVADVRAPTPSGAAELVTPDGVEWRQRLAALGQRLANAARRALADQRTRLAHLAQRLERAHPGTRLTQSAQRLDELEQRLRRAIDARLERAAAHIDALARALHAVSPLATLGRGFAIVTRSADGTLITSAEQLHAGDLIDARLAVGAIRASVVTRHD